MHSFVHSFDVNSYKFTNFKWMLCNVLNVRELLDGGLSF